MTLRIQNWGRRGRSALPALHARDLEFSLFLAQCHCSGLLRITISGPKKVSLNVVWRHHHKNRAKVCGEAILPLWRTESSLQPMVPAIRFEEAQLPTNCMAWIQGLRSVSSSLSGVQMLVGR